MAAGLGSSRWKSYSASLIWRQFRLRVRYVVPQHRGLNGWSARRFPFHAVGLEGRLDECPQLIKRGHLLRSETAKYAPKKSQYPSPAFKTCSGFAAPRRWMSVTFNLPQGTTDVQGCQRIGIGIDAALVRPGHPAHHPGAARIILADRRLGARADANAAVRRVLWTPQDFSVSRHQTENVEFPLACQNDSWKLSVSHPELRTAELSSRSVLRPHLPFDRLV